MNKGDKIAKKSAGKGESPDHEPKGINLACKETELPWFSPFVSPVVKIDQFLDAGAWWRWWLGRGWGWILEISFEAFKFPGMWSGIILVGLHSLRNPGLYFRLLISRVLTCPLGFWRGVKLRPQKTRSEDRRVRKTKQGKRPWADNRNGFTKLRIRD